MLTKVSVCQLSGECLVHIILIIIGVVLSLHTVRVPVLNPLKKVHGWYR
jgi:hypothetical protein